MVTQERLKSIVNYDPITGVFTNKVNRGRFGRIKAGTIIGTISRSVIVIRIDEVLYLAHRLAWLYMTGSFPSFEIDHINVNPTDNSWKNLREATGAENKQNSINSHADSKTGFLGVEATKCGFSARICTGGKREYLGHFKTAQEAHDVYIARKRKIHNFNTL